jgi:hypothetical protein
MVNILKEAAGLLVALIIIYVFFVFVIPFIPDIMG